MTLSPEALAGLLKSKGWADTLPDLKHILDQIETGVPEEPRIPRVRSSKSRTGFTRSRSGKLLPPKQNEE